MYVYNGNPNLINYQYTNSTDLNSAVQLLDTYMVVVKSNKVMEAVADRLIPDYPQITAGRLLHASIIPWPEEHPVITKSTAPLDRSRLMFRAASI